MANSYEALYSMQAEFPYGPWCLTSIPPNGGITETRTFYPNGRNGEEELLTFVMDNNGINNLYWHANPVRGSLSRKAGKEDIGAGVRLHTDIDPRAGENLQQEQQRILNFLLRPSGNTPPPSTIIFSGGGYQALWDLVPEDWLFIKSAEDIEEIERRNIRLAEMLDGDNCHDISRLLRLPGTINIPSDKKRARGRYPVKAEVVHRSGALYRLFDFERSEKKLALKPALLVGQRIDRAQPLTNAEFQALPVSNYEKKLIVLGNDPHQPGRYPSRSEVQWRVSCELVRAGVPDAVHKAILLDPRFGISACVLDKPDPESYADRQIGGAHVSRKI